jgi:hypothetical protein
MGLHGLLQDSFALLYFTFSVGFRHMRLLQGDYEEYLLGHNAAHSAAVG